MTTGAGDLDQQITIETKSVTRTAIGEETPAWTTLYDKIWAMALPPRVNETFAADQMRQLYEIKFVIRYRTNITREDRVDWRGKKWEIVGDPVPYPIGNPVWLDIKTVSGVRDGR